MSTVNLAIIGGRRSAGFEKSFELLKDQVAITDICDPDPAVIGRWQEKHPGIRAYERYDQLLASSSCDAVFIATPMDLHADQAISALNAGKHVLSEVIAATTLAECWQLVEAVERSGKTYMLAENYCYQRPNRMVQNLVDQGMFGDLVYAEGAYIHDCCPLICYEDGSLTWRGESRKNYNGNVYPTHSLGPVAQWLQINRADRFRRMTTWMSRPVACSRYVAERFGSDHPAADPSFFRLGDSATTLIETEKGVLISLRFDANSRRPHNMSHYLLQGTDASYLSGRFDGEDPLIWIKGHSEAQADGTAISWNRLWDFAPQFEHPDWLELDPDFAATLGHGGGDYFVLRDFVSSIRSGRRPPIDVYDAVSWSCIMPLSIESVQRGGEPVAVPDFSKQKR